MSGFAGAPLPNLPFHLAPYIPAGDNVLWDPMHHFFRMFAQINGGKMDRFGTASRCPLRAHTIRPACSHRRWRGERVG